MTRKKIGIFGSARSREESQEYRDAVEIGRIIGHAGYDLICGGYGGLMEAVSRGCSEAGGECIGVGLEHFREQPNQYIGSFVKAATLGKRLDYFLARADLFLALPGGIGTVTEVMFAWDQAKTGQSEKAPILLYGDGWEGLLQSLREGFIIGEDAFRHIRVVTHIEELDSLLKVSLSR